jgi:hypothetical protein
VDLIFGALALGTLAWQTIRRVGNMGIRING